MLTARVGTDRTGVPCRPSGLWGSKLGGGVQGPGAGDFYCRKPSQSPDCCGPMLHFAPNPGLNQFVRGAPCQIMTRRHFSASSLLGFWVVGV